MTSVGVYSSVLHLLSVCVVRTWFELLTQSFSNQSITGSSVSVLSVECDGMFVTLLRLAASM
jgi:hypothetical protein